MKLNAYLLYEHLKRKYPVELQGSPSRKLSLQAPELFIDNTTRLLSGHVYLATVEHLPPRPAIEKDVLLVCIGESPRLAYYREHTAVLQVKRKIDFFQVYKALQDIYNLYQSWESRLLEMFLETPAIQDVLLRSCPVFERPMFVLNSAFHYIASALPSGQTTPSFHWKQTHGRLDSGDFLHFLKQKEPHMDVHGPLFLELDQINVLCINLFDSWDTYIGCLCIDQGGRPFVEGEEILAEYLAKIIEKTAEASPMLLKNEHGSLKKVLQNLVNEVPLSSGQRLLLQSSRCRQEYVCVSIHCRSSFAALPVSYLCTVMEANFLNSIFFEQNNTILGLLPAGSAAFPGGKTAALLDEMQLCLGISNRFTDLHLLRNYYFQAEAALDNGQLYDPGKNVYAFSDYALMEMVLNAFGGFPAEAYFPEGFARLLQHDRESDISYAETLAVLLEENMSYAKAARRLFIHRSTLIERMSRITQELNCDLNDPDQRLQLQILLKALRVERRMKEQ